MLIMIGRVILMLSAIVAVAMGASCSSTASRSAETAQEKVVAVEAPAFDGDSAYAYVARQVAFGPRVPNSEAHRLAGDWLAGELRRHGAKVTVQPVVLTAFDGTRLNARNIFGQYNPDASRRILLMAHYDCRPWADNDPDPAKRVQPVDGANDGASGVGVLLELARQLNARSPEVGVDILFADAEDWGTSGDDASWAMGTRHFAANPPVAGYAPTEAILLDMVGAPDAVFPREWFSQQAAPDLLTAVWSTADALGLGERFVNTPGGAINDDHVELIQAGIPAIDIIDLRESGGFNDRWHTSSDNMEGISPQTLREVGQVVAAYIRSQQ